MFLSQVTFSGLRKSLTFDGFEAAELEDQALSHVSVSYFSVYLVDGLLNISENLGLYSIGLET